VSGWLYVVGTRLVTATFDGTSPCADALADGVSVGSICPMEGVP
jgi:hypothetical protein